MRARRLLEVVRITYGAVQLVAPEGYARVLGCRPRRSTRTTMRVLGVRHVGQGLLLLLVDTPQAHRTGAVVDGAHAASLVPLRHLAHGDEIRLVVCDGVVASAMALLEAALA